jgi:hypothetical protein
MTHKCEVGGMAKTFLARSAYSCFKKVLCARDVCNCVLTIKAEYAASPKWAHKVGVTFPLSEDAYTFLLRKMFRGQPTAPTPRQFHKTTNFALAKLYLQLPTAKHVSTCSTPCTAPVIVISSAKSRGQVFAFVALCSWLPTLL